MHSVSYRLMERLRSCVPSGSSVLDVGGSPVNGSYRSLFSDCKYRSLDFQDADIVVDSHDWPISEGAYDAVISGQTLEHDPFFWVTMTNIARVLRAGGHAVIIVPSKGHVHRYPVDCYRFLPDAMPALAKWSGISLVKTECVKDGKWGDVGAVFRK